MSIRFLIVFFALLSLSTQHAFSEVNSDNLMSVASKVRSVTGASTDASILVGAFSADGSLANAGSLTSGDYVNLIATIKPDSNDAGSNGELFVILLSVTNDGAANWTFLNTKGNFEDWDLNLLNLGAVKAISSLKASNSVSIFEGTLEPGRHRIAVGYMADGGPLIYTAKAFNITVNKETETNESQTMSFSGKEFLWGVVKEKLEVYAAPDVSQEHIDLTVKWVNKGIALWGNHGPLEIWIVGKSPEAAIELDKKWCEIRFLKDVTWNKVWDCANGDPYGSGDGWSPFYKCVANGCSSVSSYIKDYLGYYFNIITMSSKYPGPEEESYKKVVLHEYFHVVQHAKLAVTSIDDKDGNWRTSNRNVYFSGDEVQVPFLMEGGAEYMGQYWYSKQPDIDVGYLKKEMKLKAQQLQPYLNDGRSLRVLGYNEDFGVYAVATWFVAYLIHNTSEQKFRIDFWGQLTSLGFEEAFRTTFGKSADEMIQEFNAWIDQPVEVLLKIIP